MSPARGNKSASRKACALLQPGNRCRKPPSEPRNILMGINHDEFSEGVEPIKPITAKATTAEGGDGNEAADNGTAGAPLEPNRAAINQHLYALFHPDFVRAYPDAWIEIAYANPAAGGGLRAAQQFSAFELEAAGDFAERKNRQG
jgi:hypothetical protein